MSQAQCDMQSRIRTAFYGLAVCDALGGPLEFHPRVADPSRYVREMLPNTNFAIAEGHFTDDTSMALCLAASFTKTARSHAKYTQVEADVSQTDPESNVNSTQSFSLHDPVDQAARYVRWHDDGYMSSVPGSAFDVGNQTRQALQYWRRKPELATLDFVKEKFDFDWRGGNGSLMRVLPCALVARTEDEAMGLGRRSSEVTHSHRSCVDACAFYSLLVFWALRDKSKKYLVERLKTALDSQNDRVAGKGAVKQRLEGYESLQDWRQKSRDQISSSGYVVDSLEAALWVLFRTSTFEEGAIEVVNLGDDADTVGAIYGGIAGALYGTIDSIPARWMESLKSLPMIEQAVDGLLKVIEITASHEAKVAVHHEQ